MRRNDQPNSRESLFDEGRINTRQMPVSFNDVIKAAVELDVCNRDALSLSQGDERSDLRGNQQLQSRPRDRFFFAAKILTIVKSRMCARIHPELMT